MEISIHVYMYNAWRWLRTWTLRPHDVKPTRTNAEICRAHLLTRPTPSPSSAPDQGRNEQRCWRDFMTSQIDFMLYFMTDFMYYFNVLEVIFFGFILWDTNGMAISILDLATSKAEPHVGDFDPRKDVNILNVFCSINSFFQILSRSTQKFCFQAATLSFWGGKGKKKVALIRLNYLFSRTALPLIPACLVSLRRAFPSSCASHDLLAFHHPSPDGPWEKSLELNGLQRWKLCI